VVIGMDKIQRTALKDFITEVVEDDLLLDPVSEQEAAERERAEAFAFVQALAQELSAGIVELPAFPDVALRVRNALNSADASVEMIGRIVMSEPVLAARLVRLANCALLRRGAAVTDVRTAINRLGFDMIRNATVAWAVDHVFDGPADNRARRLIERARRHSVTVAAIAYVMASKCPGSGISADEAMLAGLLHDIGSIYILTRMHVHPELFEDNETIEKLLRDWHTGVGKAIVESWNFPEHIQLAVDEHDFLGRVHAGKADVADIVLLANLLAEPAIAAATRPGTLPAARKLQLDEQDIIDVLTESQDEIQSMIQALGA